MRIKIFLTGAAGFSVSPADCAWAVDNFTGGRFTLLQAFESSRSKGESNVEILAPYLWTTGERLNADVKLPYDHALFKSLISGPVNAQRATELLGGNSRELLGRLLQANILAVHANSTYTFNSRHVQTFFVRIFKQKKERRNAEEH